MSLRLLIGFSRLGQRGTAKVVYCGESGSELETARAQDTRSASFRILNNPLGINKSNPNFQPAGEVETAPAEAAAESELLPAAEPDPQPKPGKSKSK